jgi:uncharacterized membrane-anchored protein
MRSGVVVPDMFGRRAPHPVVTAVAVVAFLVGLVGYTAFGWRFGGGGNSVATTLGVGFAVVAVAWTLYGRFA